jgi:8-oxo-dGTP pyrophosphatase MutT (NUDIX family)
MKTEIPDTLHRAVCVLLFNREGHVLAVSRTKPMPLDREKELRQEGLAHVRSDGVYVIADREAWGLPGGKVEPNESLKQAATRECFEETGYSVGDLIPVRTRVANGCICTTFVGRIMGAAPDAPRSLPFEGDVEWAHPCALCFGGPFDSYNQALFAGLGVDHFRYSDTPVPKGWGDPYFEPGLTISE